MKEKLFKYKAISDLGNKVTGSAFANSKELAIQKIESKGYVLLKISRDYTLSFSNNLSLSDSMKFTEEVFAYVTYGLTFGEALQYVSDDERLSTGVRYSASLAASLLSKGNDISVALFKAGVNKSLSSSISAAMYSGRLEQMLPEIIKQYKTIRKIRGQWISLSIYPIMMLIILSITMAVMIGYLSPLQKKVMLNISGNNYDNIPERSKMVFHFVENFTAYIVDYVPLLLIVSICCHKLFVAKIHCYGVFTRMIWYNLPYSGSLIYKLEVASLIKNIHISLSCGLSEAEAISLVYEQTTDKFLLKKLSIFKDTVQNSYMTIGDAFEQAQLLKGIHVAILRSEKGGRDSLIKCLYNIGTSIESSVMEQLKTFAGFSGLIGDLMIYIFATPVILSIVIPQFDGILMAISKF